MNKATILLLAFSLFSSFAWAADLKVGPDEAVLLAYGSLMNRTSFEKSLGHPLEKEPVETQLTGWTRDWSAIMPNDAFEVSQTDLIPKYISYLNIRPDKNSNLNIMVYVVKKSELASFDTREWIYARQDVSAALPNLHTGGAPVYAFVAKPEFESSADKPLSEHGIRKSYLNILAKASENMSEASRIDLQKDIEEAPVKNIFDDVQLPGKDPMGYNKVKKVDCAKEYSKL